MRMQFRKIPGKKSLQLAKLRKANVSKGVHSAVPLFVQKAKGAKVWDVDGNEFIDFAGGIGASNCGHGNSKIVKAVQVQAGKFFHTAFSVMPYEGYVHVCEKLNKIIPIRGKKKSALFNSGAEGVENAVKIARKFTERPAVVSLDHGFHGRTYMALSLTGKEKPYKHGFGPFAPETYKLEYPYTYRRPAECQTEKEYVNYLIEKIENEFFTSVVEPEKIACVVMELIAGEGGFIVAPKMYVQRLAKICKKNKILLIIDEVQTGFARTGKMFATEWYDIQPDMVVTAKSLGNGMPLSAVTGMANVMDCVQENGLGGTFAGNPLSCASALEAMEFMERQKLWKKAQGIGKMVMEKFKELEGRSKYVGDVRGLGAMCAIELVKDKESKKPIEEMTKRVARKCYENGLIVLSAGNLGNVIRTLMPLVIKEKELKKGLEILEKVVMEEK